MIRGNIKEFMEHVPEKLKAIAASLTEDIAMNCDVTVSGVEITEASGRVVKLEGLVVTAEAHPNAKVTIVVIGDDVGVLLDERGKIRAVRRPFATTPAIEVTRFVRAVFKGALD